VIGGGLTAIESAGDRLAARIDAVVNQGRVQGLASGGFARGTDTAIAALTPGEVVMYRQARQKWFSDLQRMNAGMQPQFRQSGGPVTVSVGDINVNEAASPRETVDQIWHQLERKFRTGGLTPNPVTRGYENASRRMPPLRSM